MPLPYTRQDQFTTSVDSLNARSVAKALSSSTTTIHVSASAEEMRPETGTL